MREFQERKRIKAKMYSKPVLIGLLVLALLLGKAVANIFMKYRDSVEAKRIAEAKLTDLEGRKKALEADIKNLESSEGREAEMRKKFNVANPGEQLIVVVESEAEAGQEEKKGFFGGFWGKIKSWFD